MTAHASGPRRADARRNRDAVLAAAVRVLSERPDASMREVAEASDLGRTTVYRHFPQREDLVRALFARVYEEAHEIAVRAVDAGRASWAAGGSDALDVVATLTAAFADLGERYRFLGAHRELEAEGRDALSAEHGGEPLLSYLAEAQARGEVRDDLTVPWMMDVVHGLAMMGAQHAGPGGSTAEELRPMLVATVRGALGPARR